MRTEEEAAVLRRLRGMLNSPFEVPEQFGDAIRELLNKANLPVSTIAHALNCSELMIQLWERNRRLPGEDILPDLTSSVITFIDLELQD